jgi:hypothetical protein
MSISDIKEIFTQRGRFYTGGRFVCVIVYVLRFVVVFPDIYSAVTLRPSIILHKQNVPLCTANRRDCYCR